MSLRPPGFRRLPPPVGRDFGFYDPMGSYPPDFRRVPRMPPPPPPPPNMFTRMPFGGRGGGPRGFAPRPQIRPREQGGMNKGVKRKFVEADNYRNSGYPTECNRPMYDSAGPPPQQQRLMQNRPDVAQELDETGQFPQTPSPPGMRPQSMENTSSLVDSDQSGEAGVTENLRIPPDLIQPLYCKLCDTRLNGTLQATAHYDGKNHKKKERQYLEKLRREKGIKTPVPVPQANGKTENKEKKTDVMKPEDMYCKACDVAFNSDVQAKQHYNGRNHQRRVRGEPPLPKGFFNPVTGKWQRQPPTGVPFKPQPSAKKQKFICTVCDATMTSQLQLDAHLIGAKHKTKLATQERQTDALRGKWAGTISTAAGSVDGEIRSIIKAVQSYCACFTAGVKLDYDMVDIPLAQ